MKVKVSFTLASELVAQLDRQAHRASETRSALAERWLRVGANRAAERALDEATAAYYQSLTEPEHAENEAIARASSTAAKRIEYDRRPRRRR